MATVDNSHVNLEDGGVRCHSTATSDGGSDGSSHSSDPDMRLSYEEHRISGLSGTEILGVSDKRRESSVSECSVEVDLEAGLQEIKVHLAKGEKDCRICHLSLDVTNQESGVPIELGCSCKNDLAAAHKQCAEAWFKIKGNKTCEICGSMARNVAGANAAELMEQWNEANEATAAAVPSAETQNFWRGHWFLNFLLACMVFAFLISWLFHFNVPA